VTLSLTDLGYRYPRGEHPALRDVRARVSPGERVLVTGPSGGGKSTLVRLIAGLTQRHGAGQVSGEVRLGQDCVAALTPAQRVQRLGFVGQEPGVQVVTGSLRDEVAMGPESACWSVERVRARVAELLAAHLPGVDPDRDPMALSGGQQQRVAVAAGVAAGAPLLVLDEPLAQLDPVAAQALLAALHALSDEGIAVILVEHRLEACFAWATRLWLVEDGALCWDGPAATMTAARLRQARLLVPEQLLLDEAASAKGERWEALEDRAGTSPQRAAPAALGPLLMAHEGLVWRAGEREVLHGVDVRLHARERVAVLGANGAGKSSLLAALAQVEPRCLLVPQDPDLSLFCATVGEELRYGPLEQGLSDVQERVDAVLAALRLTEVRERSPQALSRGQRLRVAVGAALCCAPDVLLLDEPTSGQDLDAVEGMMELLGELLGERILVFATHDVGLALRHATTVWVVDEGRLLASGPPLTILGALPTSIPLRLGPIASACVARGWPLCDAATLVERLR